MRSTVHPSGHPFCSRPPSINIPLTPLYPTEVLKQLSRAELEAHSWQPAMPGPLTVHHTVTGSWLLPFLFVERKLLANDDCLQERSLPQCQTLPRQSTLGFNLQRSFY